MKIDLQGYGSAIYIFYTLAKILALVTIHHILILLLLSLSNVINKIQTPQPI